MSLSLTSGIKRKSSKKTIQLDMKEEPTPTPSETSPRSVEGFSKNPNYKKSKSIFRIFEKTPLVEEEDWMYHTGPKIPFDCYKTNRFGSRQHRTLM
jgi:hypothetical protein